MTKIPLHFIVEEKYFSIEYVNYQMQSINFGFESANVPVDISFDYIKRNDKLRMSGAEALFFTRYFGIMVGTEIPQHNEIWNLYEKLLEIVHILTSPVIAQSHILQLNILITKHHNFIIHYLNLVSKIGPLINLSTNRFESKHCEVKKMLSGSNCNKNVLKSIGIRHQLSKMNIRFTKYKKKRS